MDEAEMDGIRWLLVVDLASRYRFDLLLADALPATQVVAHLETLFRLHKPPHEAHGLPLKEALAMAPQVINRRSRPCLHGATATEVFHTPNPALARVFTKESRKETRNISEPRKSESKALASHRLGHGLTEKC
jgi:hypothetical protein